MSKLNADIEREFDQWAKDEAEIYGKQQEINQTELVFVKNNIKFPFEKMEEMLDQDWSHVGYVEIEKSDFKSSAYPKHET